MSTLQKDYQNFLAQKAKTKINSGFDVDEINLNPMLFPFQKFVVARALKHGKYAIFEDCGLGKSVQQIEFAYQCFLHTGKPSLILAPLAVVGQTIKEGVKFNRHIAEWCNDSIEMDNPIQISNYEQLENIDTSIYDCIVLDECFSPDTLVQYYTGKEIKEKPIKDIKIGEKIVNCTGFDSVLDNKKKKIEYAIKIRYNGRYIICSPRHPFFTQRGWVAAKELQYFDYIISTEKTMRILQCQYSNEMENGYKEAVLYDILRSEMENESANYNTEDSYKRNPCKNRQESVCMDKERFGENSNRKNTQSKSYATTIMQGQSIKNSKINESQTFNAWGKWERDDIASAINEGCSIRQLDTGICHIFGKTSKGLSNKLQSRFSSLREKNCNRSGWELTLQQKRSGQEKGFNTGYFRVESFEVLESSDCRLDKYRDEEGTLYFYDLTIERHPSFTVNNCLVHNSSILKNYEGETKKLILEKFALTPYKLACTATPSPNDPMELGNHSEFLDVMTRNEMLAMFFVHDGGETAKWRIKGHAKKPFYKFISTFSIMMSKPQDIGFEMEGYDLPSLNFIEKCIETEKKENGRLFNDTAISATTFNQELRLTKMQRLSEVVEIVNNSTENFIIWIKQNEEGEYLKKLIPDAIEVKGSDSNEYKKKHLLGFANNDFRVLITKSKIAAFGLNYQNCRNQIFASLDFSFEALYQSIRRSYRFGQKEEVNIYILSTDTMTNVIQSINRKQKQFEEMQSEMTAEICANLNTGLVNAVYDTESVSNEFYTAKRGDCVQLIRELEDESIGLSVFSPPFAELYTYSNHLEDMGNSKNYKEFLTQFSYLVKELYRVLKSGRNVAVHCMDLPIQKGKEGFIGLRDFSGMIRESFEKEGFIYHSRITVFKDPVVEMQRTKALGLLHKQVKKDSTMSRVGLPDYVLVFRKDGERNDKVNCDINVDTWQKYASPIWEFKDLSKEFEMVLPMLSESAYNEIPQELRNKYASPCWDDINYSNTLQYTTARGANDEKHICPLQLDTIERLIHLYSNKGDTVLTPFGGIGSEIYQALKMDRKAVAFELKESYFQKLKENASNAIKAKAQTSLF